MLDLAHKHAPVTLRFIRRRQPSIASSTITRPLSTAEARPQDDAIGAWRPGLSYELAGDKQSAADAYAKAANADPKNIGYQLSAAQSQLRVGDLEKTKSYLSRAAAINPNSYRVHATRALLAKTENNKSLDRGIQSCDQRIAARTGA